VPVSRLRAMAAVSRRFMVGLLIHDHKYLPRPEPDLNAMAQPRFILCRVRNIIGRPVR
jgi:hypothetical protein